MDQEEADLAEALTEEASAEVREAEALAEALALTALTALDREDTFSAEDGSIGPITVAEDALADFSE